MNAARRQAVINQILGSSYDYISPYTKTAYSTFSQVTSKENSNYTLEVLFYVFLYIFLIYLVLLLINYTITPIFSFIPGSAGVIGIPGNGDNIVYMNTGLVPVNKIVPVSPDLLSTQNFINKFSFSVDLYLRRLTDTASGTRLILYKTSSAAAATPLAAPPTGTGLADYMAQNSSMFMYLTNTNDLIISFVNNTGTLLSSPPIQNVPLYTPFRISVVVESKLFTVYLNGKQTGQAVNRGPITSPAASTNQVFITAASWANSPVRTVFVQNFNLWPRAIAYTEVVNAQPALAPITQFGAEEEQGTSSSCSTN